jgi:acetylornithine/N-succinyldiaminopimelate aminotransferase
MDHILNCHEIVKLDFVRGENCYLYDVWGRRYIDFESGIWCTVLGHNHKRLNRLMHTQIEQIIHLGTRYPTFLAEEAAIEVLSILGFPDGKCIFLSSGSEAVEFGVQMARRISDKPLLLALKNAYLTAYGSAGRKIAAEWHLFDWNACTTCSNTNACDPQCNHLGEIPLEQIGGFVFEPGGSGPYFVQFPPKQVIRALAELVSKQNGLIVINEITTGMGRTGKWFGYQHYEIQPDIVALGKGLGNGYPVSAVAMSHDLALKIEDSGLRYAQSHQNDPLGCAIVKEVIAILREERLIERGCEVGGYFLEGLHSFVGKHRLVKVARGRSMLLAVELQPHRFTATRAYYEFLDRGFLVGYYPVGNILRFDPSLTIDEEDISLLLENFDSILKTACAES